MSVTKAESFLFVIKSTCKKKHVSSGFLIRKRQEQGLQRNQNKGLTLLNDFFEDKFNIRFGVFMQTFIHSIYFTVYQ